MTTLLIIVYSLILLFTTIRVLLDTESTPKTLAYLLLIFMIPVIGIAIYFSFGINYRHQEFNRKGAKIHLDINSQIGEEISDETRKLAVSKKDEIDHFSPMVDFLLGLEKEELFSSHFKLLINGEKKFPEVILSLEKAKKFIFMEYYAWENDVRGNQIKEILLRKAKEGVIIKVLYDDYASRKIKKNIVKELKQAGIQVFPKIKVKLTFLANRVNHRDHRKIIIIDGETGFIGGINISDRYDNSIDTGLYWRDTHLKIMGPLVNSLHRHFLVSWNASADQPIRFKKENFITEYSGNQEGVLGVGQIVAGGPIYPKSNIMMSYFRIFTLAKERLYITNPYFIPSESILNALCQAAISGVDVRLILPKKSDSAIVGAASKFYFSELLDAGVKIFLYKKGFVHAKTVVADSKLTVIGTANMDIRSFDLNFEIMSILYGKGIGKELENVFIDDLNYCEEMTNEEWKKTTTFKRIAYAISRLISSFL